MKGFKKMFINQYFKPKPKYTPVKKLYIPKPFVYKYPVPFGGPRHTRPWNYMAKRKTIRDIRNANRMFRQKLPSELGRKIASYLR